MILLMMVLSLAAMFNFGYNLFIPNSANLPFNKWLNESVEQRYGVCVQTRCMIVTWILQTIMTVSTQELVWSALTTCWFIGLLIGSTQISRVAEWKGRKGKTKCYNWNARNIPLYMWFPHRAHIRSTWFNVGCTSTAVCTGRTMGKIANCSGLWHRHVNGCAHDLRTRVPWY